MIFSGIKLVMTVIGIAVSTLFIVFVCTRLIWARIYLTAARRESAGASGSDVGTLERGRRCHEPFELSKFPVRKYGELCLFSTENAQCTVCLAEYHDEDTLRILPVCGHSFHATCIDPWLHQHFTCPICRISLRELPDRKCFMQPVFSPAIRSQYTMQSTNAHHCHCMFHEHSCSLRSNNTRITDPIQEGGGPDTRVVAGSASTCCGQTNQADKDAVDVKVESPSNQ